MRSWRRSGRRTSSCLGRSDSSRAVSPRSIPSTASWSSRSLPRASSGKTSRMSSSSVSCATAKGPTYSAIDRPCVHRQTRLRRPVARRRRLASFDLSRRVPARKRSRTRGESGRPAEQHESGAADRLGVDGRIGRVRRSVVWRDGTWEHQLDDEPQWQSVRGTRQLPYVFRIRLGRLLRSQRDFLSPTCL